LSGENEHKNKSDADNEEKSNNERDGAHEIENVFAVPYGWRSEDPDFAPVQVSNTKPALARSQPPLKSNQSKSESVKVTQAGSVPRARPTSPETRKGRAS